MHRGRHHIKNDHVKEEAKCYLDIAQDRDDGRTCLLIRVEVGNLSCEVEEPADDQQSETTHV